MTKNGENELLGYARISSREQSLSRQIKNLEKYNPVHIYKDVYTGRRLDRPEFTKLLNRLGKGDTVVFDEVSRMSRNANEGFALYKELYEKGVKLVFIKEPHINTEEFEKALKVTLPKIEKNHDDLTEKLMNSILQDISDYMLARVEQDILNAFKNAQREVDYLRARTAEGMQVARSRGKQIGAVKGSTHETKKARAAKEVIRKHAAAFGGSLSDVDCRKIAGVSRNSYFKYKRELLEELS